MIIICMKHTYITRKYNNKLKKNAKLTVSRFKIIIIGITFIYLTIILMLNVYIIIL